ncbi:hypothetical protein RND71_030707 [Anisodus tanguticus]|uniref:Isopenicillin N synthase-like Fe(2+) 2OG dioxygenase domain-containing protein n=1 Tax=Anisodus tanguticus TaxID=243964 RepID=A0AAE1RHP2_9SOLA|nr:hypothetical protein RND71_030707 [Anisodus tanguticus]
METTLYNPSTHLLQAINIIQPKTKLYFLPSIWSNGMYKSIEHRAVTNKEKVRISIATTMFPADTVELEPVETMIDEQRPNMYKKVKGRFYEGPKKVMSIRQRNLRDWYETYSTPRTSEVGTKSDRVQYD